MGRSAIREPALRAWLAALGTIAFLAVSVVSAGITFAEDAAPEAAPAVTESVPPAEAAAPAEAAPAAPTADTGDTAWMLAASALVLFMTPGLAFFYGGMVRKKNVLGTMMHSFVAMGVLSIAWALVGYSLAFSGSGEYVGDLAAVGLSGVGSGVSGTIPDSVFMIYQCMFFIITPALFSGAIAERIKFSSYLFILVGWALIAYAPICHMVWDSDGLLFKDGAMDFAGGTVVHINAAVAAAVLVWLLGKRRDYPKEITPPHNLPFAVLGTGMLWFGWFGFNAGSALGANALAGYAFVNTNLGAAAAASSWMFWEWLRRGKPTALGFMSGAVGGLVIITPACGFVTPMGAIVMCAIGGIVCFETVALRAKLQIDDSLDVLGVHGMGGTLGALLVGLFASKTINSAGKDGLFYGGGIDPFIVQIKGVVITIVVSAVVTFVLAKIADMVFGLRVSDEEEAQGLDLTQHGEVGYT
ncbi:MAG: ammonium transporter [Bdellovibrionota bacterium]